MLHQNKTMNPKKRKADEDSFQVKQEVSKDNESETVNDNAFNCEKDECGNSMDQQNLDNGGSSEHQGTSDIQKSEDDSKDLDQSSEQRENKVPMYTIVYFCDGLELIPTKWRTADNNSYYPPYCSRSRLENAIKVMEDPEPFWKKCTIKRVFGTAATYEQGTQKLEAATKESELETDGESLGERQNQLINGESAAKKQRRTCEINDSSSDNEFSMISVPLLKLPSPGWGSPSLSATLQRISNFQSSTEERSSDDDFKDFLKKSIKEIFKKLNRLEEKVDALQQLLTDSNRNLNSEAESENIFPLASVQDLEDLEKKLEDVSFFKKTVNTLKSIGGTDNYSVVIGAVKRVLSNEVAEQYSLAGAKKKRCFKNLILCKVLLEAVRCHRPTITEVEFGELIGRWLVQAKLRRERAEEQKMRKRTTV